MNVKKHLSEIDVPRWHGWHFSDDDVEQASKDRRMLMLDTETSSICNMRCPYCFRSDARDGGRPAAREMDLALRIKLVQEARALGCESVKIVGAGEPLVDPLFWEQAEEVVGLGMQLLVNTNGLAINDDAADRLAGLGASVKVKFNSMDPEVEDAMVDYPGYYRLRNRALDRLIQRGFNTAYPSRLAIDTVITTENVDRLLPILRFARSQSIIPYIKTFIPKGGSIGLSELKPGSPKVQEAAKELRACDREEFGIVSDPNSNYIGGPPCSQLRYALYVDIQGQVFSCPGAPTPLGSFYDHPLEYFWNHEMTRRFSTLVYRECPFR